MAISTGHIINQRYRVVKTITQGGFGRLYRAWDLSLKRPVALKQNLDDTEVGREQFETEALILADLHHPNLARVTDYFLATEEGQFLVMDFVEGEDLQSMIDQRGPLPEEQAIIWISQVCEALTFIHNQHPPIIHRDIKPANIRITPEGKAILVDFGIAKTYSPGQVTVTGARAVTPGYAPVEQYGSARTDARSDVYAVGATLYALLTGKEPPESINLVSGTPLPKLRTLNDQISRSTEDAVHKAMALQPDDRYQTITSLQTDLKLEVKPAQKTSARNRWLPKVLLLLLAVLIIIDIAAIVTSYLQVSVVSSIIRGEEITGDNLLNTDRWHQTITLIQLVVWVLTSAVFLAWIYSASRYVKTVSRSYRYSPLWAAVGCLMPVYNIVHPYRVVKSLWISSSSNSQEDNLTTQSSASGVVLLWWIASLLSVTAIIITVVFASNNLSLAELQIAGLMYVGAYFINSIAAALTIFIVFKIDQMQEKKVQPYQMVDRTMQIS